MYYYRTLAQAGGPPGGATFAYDINNSGQIVGYYNTSEGFLYNNGYFGGNYTTLPPSTTDPTGINNAGVIVGNYTGTDGLYYSFTYNSVTRTYAGLPSDPLGVQGTVASGINDLGGIVGTYFDSGTKKTPSCIATVATVISRMHLVTRQLRWASITPEKLSALITTAPDPCTAFSTLMLMAIWP